MKRSYHTAGQLRAWHDLHPPKEKFVSLVSLKACLPDGNRRLLCNPPKKGENALNPLSTQKKERMRLQEDVT